ELGPPDRGRVEPMGSSRESNAMKRARIAGILGCVVLAAALAAQGGAPGALQADRPTPKGADTLDSINADFERELGGLEKKRLERRARLAASQPKEEAEKTYEAYFRYVIAGGYYGEAEATAEKVLKSEQVTPPVAVLAALVNIVAEANRGAYQESLDNVVK